MTILGVETATSLQSVAIVGDNGICAEERGTRATTTSSQPPSWSIMPAIDHLLQTLKITLQEIDGFAASIGPGSFTSLRVGIATIQGLAYGTGKPVIAVPTLNALAMNAIDQGTPICSILDAKRGELFIAIFHAEQKIESQPKFSAILEAKRIPLTQVVKHLTPHINGRVTFVGDGLSLCQEELTTHFGRHACLIPEASRFPSAQSVAKIGKIRLAHDMLGDGRLSPIYLRPPDATPNLPHRDTKPIGSIKSKHDH